VNKQEAYIIFESFKGYVEVADKFSRLMITPPESFLPYPACQMEEALDMVARDFTNNGDHKTANDIQSLAIRYVGCYYSAEKERNITDLEALKDMKRAIDLLLSKESFALEMLENVRDGQRSWMETRNKS
jgi:hypothetical protein